MLDRISGENDLLSKSFYSNQKIKWFKFWSTGQLDIVLKAGNYFEESVDRLFDLLALALDVLDLFGQIGELLVAEHQRWLMSLGGEEGRETVEEMKEDLAIVFDDCGGTLLDRFQDDELLVR